MADMTYLQKSEAYYRAVAMQHRKGAKPPFVPCRVRLLRRVYGDFPTWHLIQIGPGEFDCECNVYGAVSVTADNGRKLGLRLNEFETIAWVENPGA